MRFLNALIVIAITIVSTAIFLAGSEWYLRENIFNPNLRFMRTPGWQIVFRPTPEGTPGIFEDAHIKINALGIRGDTPNFNSSPRILAVGGSTTEDVLLNDRKTWVGRLQERLRQDFSRAWVGNAGKAGTSAIHHALLIEEMLPRLKVERVIVLLGLNDMLYDARIHLGDTVLGPDWDLRQAFMYIPPNEMHWYERLSIYQLAKRTLDAFQLDRAQAAALQTVNFGDMSANYKKRRS